MFDIGFGEMVLLAAIALVAIGPKQLPEVARVLGRMMADFKRATNDFTRSIADARDSTQNTLNETARSLNETLTQTAQQVNQSIQQPLQDSIQQAQAAYNQTPSQPEPPQAAATATASGDAQPTPSPAAEVAPAPASEGSAPVEQHSVAAHNEPVVAPQPEVVAGPIIQPAHGAVPIGASPVTEPEKKES